MSDIKRILTEVGAQIEKMVADHQTERERLSLIIAQQKQELARVNGERERHYYDAVQALAEARKAQDERDDLRERVRELEERLNDRVDPLASEHVEAAE